MEQELSEKKCQISYIRIHIVYHKTVTSHQITTNFLMFMKLNDDTKSVAKVPRQAKNQEN